MSAGVVTALAEETFVSEVTASNWAVFMPSVMKIEHASFPASIRDSSSYYSRLTRSPASIFLALSVARRDNIVGYLAADALERFPRIRGLVLDPHFRRRDTIYIASVAVDAAWRHRGFGIDLQRECLRRAASRGFVRATAHVHHGALAHMRLEGTVIQSFPNWYGTGRTFDYIEIPTASWRAR